MSRLTASTDVVAVEQASLMQLRASERLLRQENSALSAAATEAKATAIEKTAALEDVESEMRIATKQEQATGARNAELQLMCSNLSEELKTERKKR